MKVQSIRPDESNRAEVISILVAEVDRNINELALGEGAVPKAARKLLRLRRDGAPKPEVLEAFKPFWDSMARLIEKDDSELKQDKDGYLREPVILPRRKHAAA